MAGVPRLRVAGLAQEAAVGLLLSSLPEPIDPAAAAQIAVATGGNPLALIDLADELSVKRLTEAGLADEPIPVGPRLEAFYLRRVRLLTDDEQLWLLVAAADSTGNVDLIRAAGTALGLPASAGDAAEAAGLVELSVTVRFRHPLVRSAVYGAAPGSERRRVHAALAAAAADLGRVELEAWHAAKATLGTDAAVADRLERVADLAGQRGGGASRASVLAQASALTPEGTLKYARLVSAAEAALAAGAAQLAGSMLDEVDERRSTRCRPAGCWRSAPAWRCSPATRRCGGREPTCSPRRRRCTATTPAWSRTPCCRRSTSPCRRSGSRPGCHAHRARHPAPGGRRAAATASPRRSWRPSAPSSCCRTRTPYRRCGEAVEAISGWTTRAC